MSVRLRVRKAAARTVVFGSGFHTTPIFGLAWFRDSEAELSVSKKSPLAPSVIMTVRCGLMYVYRYRLVCRTSRSVLVSNAGMPKIGLNSIVMVLAASTSKYPAPATVLIHFDRKMCCASTLFEY